MSAKHALLVDDSKSARYALRQVLQRKGFEVDMAESAEVALEKVSQTKVDAIFMDHMMPGMDGYEAAAILKGDPASAHIPIVMCTSNDQEEYVRKARETGAVGILPKPPTVEKLAEIMQLVEHEMAHTSASEQQAAPTATPAPVPAQAAAVAAPTTPDIDAMIRAQLPGLVSEAVLPLIEQTIAQRVSGLQQQLADQQNGALLPLIEQTVSERVADLQQQLAGQQSQAVAPLIEQTVTEQVAGLQQQLADRQSEAVLPLIEQTVTERVADLQQQLAGQQSQAVAPLIEQMVTEQVAGLQQQLADRQNEAVLPLIEQTVTERVAALQQQLTDQQGETTQTSSNQQTTDFQTELNERITEAMSGLRAELTGGYQVYFDDTQRESAERTMADIDARIAGLSRELTDSVREQVEATKGDLSGDNGVPTLVEQTMTAQVESAVDQRITAAVREAGDVIAAEIYEQTHAQLKDKLRTTNRKVLAAGISGGLIAGCCSMLFFLLFGG